MKTTEPRKMTEAQMNWNLKKGFAWFGINSDGSLNDHWASPIWTKDGGWIWNTPTPDGNGFYSLEIV